MNIFETIGLLWVIFTSVLSTLAIAYLTIVGLRTVVNSGFFMRRDIAGIPIVDSADRVEVTEPLKVAR